MALKNFVSPVKIGLKLLLGIQFLIIIKDWPVISFQHEPILFFDMAAIHHSNSEKGPLTLVSQGWYTSMYIFLIIHFHKKLLYEHKNRHLD